MSRTQQMKLSANYLALSKANVETTKRKPSKAKFIRKKAWSSMKSLEKMRNNQLVYIHVNSWLASNQPECTQCDVSEMLHILKSLMKKQGLRLDNQLLSSVIIYAERYVKLNGDILQSQLFQLLLIAAFVCVKFWHDAGPDDDVFASFCGLSKKEIALMERNFLTTINYSLYINTTDIEIFQSNAITC
jgi:hypothetical protein